MNFYQQEKDCPPAGYVFGGPCKCECICHRVPNTYHAAPCCYPKSMQEGTDDNARLLLEDGNTSN